MASGRNTKDLEEENEKLRKIVKALKKRNKRLEKFEKARLVRNSGRRAKYANNNTEFAVNHGYKQLRCKWNQGNVSVHVQQRVLEVGNSRGQACMCCSLMFLAANWRRKAVLWSSKQFARAMMRGVHLDHLLRQTPGEPIVGHPEMWDLHRLNGTFSFDGELVKFTYEDIGYHSNVDELCGVIKSKTGNLMIVQNDYFHAIHKDEHGVVRIFNCHAVASNVIGEPKSHDSAAIIEAKNAEQAASLLFIFSNASVDAKCLFNCYSIYFK